MANQQITVKFKAMKGVPAREPIIAAQEIPQLSELDLTNSSVQSWLNALITDAVTSIYRPLIVEAGTAVDDLTVDQIIQEYMSDGRSGVPAERFTTFAESVKEFLKSKGKSGPAVSQLITSLKKRLKDAAFVKESTLAQWEKVVLAFAQVEGVAEEFSDVLEVLASNINKARNASDLGDDLI